MYGKFYSIDGLDGTKDKVATVRYTMEAFGNPVEAVYQMEIILNRQGYAFVDSFHEHVKSLQQVAINEFVYAASDTPVTFDPNTGLSPEFHFFVKKL